MKSFLIKNKEPVCKWGKLPDDVFFEGDIPEGYKLAISPSKGYIILDVDVDIKKSKNGFNNIPLNILKELNTTFNYSTPRGGRHYWLKYTGTSKLYNRASKYHIDLRTNNGYVAFYQPGDIRDYMDKIKNTSDNINKWLDIIFPKKIFQ